MRCDSVSGFVKAVSVLLLVVVAICLLIARIASVNNDVSQQLSPNGTPGVWQLNEREVASLPWSVPSSAGMTYGYYDGVSIIDIGTLTLENYDTFTSHVDLPVDYQEFDQRGTVCYALLPLTLSNTSDDEVLIQFSDFWLFCGIVPGSYAQGVMAQLNGGNSATIAPGSQEHYTVVYRILRNGFRSDEKWESMADSSFKLVVLSYPDKFNFPLTVG